MDKIDQELIKLALGNEDYAAFNKRIVNTSKQVYGVRIPDLRKLAKKLALGATTDTISKLLGGVNDDIYEQVALVGFVISYAKISDDDKIELIKRYLDKVDSWALIDSFVAKTSSFEHSKFWDFAVSCLTNQAEFTVRYGVIMMMTNYLDFEHLAEVFAQIRQVKHDGYYVKMAIAWLFATAAVNFYDETLHELESPEIDAWTKKKALQKMLESYRLNDIQKQEIRKLR